MDGVDAGCTLRGARLAPGLRARELRRDLVGRGPSERVIRFGWQGCLTVGLLFVLLLASPLPVRAALSSPITIDGINGLHGLACPSVSQCTAIDYNRQEVTFNPTSPGSPTPTTIDSTAELS